MKKQTVLTAVALIASAVLLLAGCTRYPPTQPNQIDINITNNNGNGSNPEASPSPSPGSGAVARVGVGQFGERCPVGVIPSGDGRSSTVKVSCTAFITCSPFSASGTEIFDLGVIGPAPEVFQALAGDGTLVQVQAASNPYNLDVLAKAVGTASFTCRVRGVTSPNYSLRVVP